MNGLPYYKRYPRDFIEGTLGMSFEAKGAYAIVLDLIYMQGGNLPDDARYISGLLNVSVRKWKALRNELVADGKIQVSGDFLTNYRAVSELETLAKLQEKQSENASGPRKNNDLEKPRLSHTEPDTDIDNKYGRFDDFWDCFADKRGRAAALRTWKRHKLDSIADEVIAGAKRYVASRGTDRRYWKQAQGWLNDGRWADEPDVPDSKPIPADQQTVFVEAGTPEWSAWRAVKDDLKPIQCSKGLGRYLPSKLPPTNSEAA